ncbi:MAG: TetR/AcrR family transcriptional regulator [Pseudomonadota bacterium]
MVEKTEKRPPGRPREFNYTAALDAAVDVFWEYGYEDADTTTLCDRMKITKPSLYNAFGAKEDLFLMALKRYNETVSSAHAEHLFKAASPLEGLREYFFSIARSVSGRDRPPGCFFGCVAIPAAHKLPNVAKAVRKSTENGHNTIRAYFEGEKKKGALPASFDTNAAVSVLQDLMIAMGIKGRMGASFKDLKHRASRNADLVLIAGQRKSLKL